MKDFHVIKLNARQLSKWSMPVSRAVEVSHSDDQIIRLAIYAVTINGERNVEFSYDDPNIQILAEDDPR